MKTDTVMVPKPKTKKAALNLAAYITQQLEICKKRKENLLMNLSNAQGKLKKLEETLANITRQIEDVNISESDWKEKLDRLQAEFELTQSEILEVRSEILRKQISSLQAEAGILETGKTTLN